MAVAIMMTSYSAFSVSQYHSILFQYVHHLTEQDIGWALFWGSSMYFLTPFLMRAGRKNKLNSSAILALALIIEAISLYLLPRVSPTWSYFAFIGFSIGSQLTGSLVSSICIFLLQGSKGDRNFLFVRSLGTVAFASTCFLNSQLAHYFDLREIYWVFVIMAALAAVFAWQSRNSIQESTNPALAHWSLWQNSWLWPLVGLITLANMSAFSGSIYLGSLVRNHFHGSDSDVSLAWTIATGSEVPIIWLAAWLIPKIPLQWIFALGMFSTAAKMLISALSPSLWGLFLGQIFHGFFFGASLSAVGLLIKSKIPKEQVPLALMSCTMIYAGLSNALSGVLSGFIWSFWDLPTTFLIWAALAFFAGLGTIRLRF